LTQIPGAGDCPPETTADARAGIYGVVLLDKEAGCTSFQALSGLKHKLGTGRIGHAGTLDKFAEGLLIVLVGRCTRLVPLFQGLDKEYVARIRFGVETDTLDPEGEVVAEGPVPERKIILEALPALTGEILQTPPAYSAVHVQGSRASKLARRGMTPEIAPRTVRIHGIEPIGYDAPELTIRVSCSKGTYIRSLARDLALLCGSRAHVTGLRRTAIGPFRVENAVKDRDFERTRDLRSPSLLGSIGGAWTCLTAKTAFVPLIRKGIPFREEFLLEPAGGEGSCGLFSQDGELLALLERDGSGFRYAAVFPEGPS